MARRPLYISCWYRKGNIVKNHYISWRPHVLIYWDHVRSGNRFRNGIICGPVQFWLLHKSCILLTSKGNWFNWIFWIKKCEEENKIFFGAITVLIHLCNINMKLCLTWHTVLSSSSVNRECETLSRNIIFHGLNTFFFFAVSFFETISGTFIPWGMGSFVGMCST